ALAIITNRTSFYRRHSLLPKADAYCRVAHGPVDPIRRFTVLIPMSQSDSAEFIAGYPLKAHNTFGFDVRAQLACRIEHESQLMAAVRDPRASGLARLVLGGGSN